MMQTQSAIDPSLAALLQTAQMVTPDGGRTVAANVAQAAQQKMQPQGIMQGMNQVRQDVQAAAPSVARNAQEAQMRQALQLAMQPKPAGIEGLPSNIRMAEGGVVGFASRGYVDPQFPEVYETTEEDLYTERLRESAKRRQEEEERRRKLEFLETAGAPQAAQYRQPQAAAIPNIPEGSDRRLNIPAGGIVSPGMAVSAPAPRPPASPAAPAAPTGVAAALAQRPTYDAASIPAAGAPYITTGEGNVTRIRKAEGDRAEFEKTLPDLSAKGIEALRQRMTDVEASEASRKESLGLDRVIQQLLGRAQGAGGAARADIQFMNAQRAAEDAFSQAKLGNQQAQLLLEKAQQERQLGRFDRAIALEKEASALMEKAQDNALKAQEIRQRSVGAQFTGEVQMYEGAQNRAKDFELERIRRATASMPGETERILAEFNRRKAKDPADAEQYMQLIERISSRGRGMDLKETSVELRALKDEEQQLLKRLEATFSSQERGPINARLEQISRDRVKLMGGTSTAAPTGGVITPKSQAEFNALPKGARYINPADGKEYIKN